VPLGTEEKYFNTVAFYDFVVDLQNLDETFERDILSGSRRILCEPMARRWRDHVFRLSEM